MKDYNEIAREVLRRRDERLAAAAKRDNMTLIAVVLNCYDMFEECKALLSGGFSDYTLKLTF